MACILKKKKKKEKRAMSECTTHQFVRQIPSGVLSWEGISSATSPRCLIRSDWLTDKERFVFTVP